MFVCLFVSDIGFTEVKGQDGEEWGSLAGIILMCQHGVLTQGLCW